MKKIGECKIYSHAGSRSLFHIPWKSATWVPGRELEKSKYRPNLNRNSTEEGSSSDSKTLFSPQLKLQHLCSLWNVRIVAINVQQSSMDDTVHWQMQQLELELHQPCANYHYQRRLLVQPPLLKISWSWWPPLLTKEQEELPWMPLNRGTR